MIDYVKIWFMFLNNSYGPLQIKRGPALYLDKTQTGDFFAIQDIKKQKTALDITVNY